MHFAVFQHGAAEFLCAAGTEGTVDSGAVFGQLQALFQDAKYEDCAALIRRSFPKQYPLSSMFLDVRRKVVDLVLRKMDEETDQKFTQVFEAQYPVVRGLQLIGATIPKPFLTVAEFVLSNDLKAQFRAADVNVNEIEELMEDVKTLGLDVSKGPVREAVSEKLERLAFAFARNPADTSGALKLVEFLNYAEIFGFEPDTVRAQEFVFLGLRSLGEEAKKKDILRALARKLKIAI